MKVSRILLVVLILSVFIIGLILKQTDAYIFLVIMLMFVLMSKAPKVKKVNNEYTPKD